MLAVGDYSILKRLQMTARRHCWCSAASTHKDPAGVFRPAETAYRERRGYSCCCYRLGLQQQTKGVGDETMLVHTVENHTHGG